MFRLYIYIIHICVDTDSFLNNFRRNLGRRRISTNLYYHQTDSPNDIGLNLDYRNLLQCLMWR